jgi:hypothetical protein
MNLIEHTTAWVNGEVLQGKIMLSIGTLFLVAAIAIFKSEHELLKGSLIPLGLIILMLCGYGGFQVFGRPPHIQKVSEAFAHSPETAVKRELEKAQKDDRVYSKIKIIWIILLAIIAIGSLFISTDLYKGLSIGLMVMFLSMLIIDTTLHHRLQVYLNALTQLP